MSIPARHVLYPDGWSDHGLIAQTDWATGCIRWFERQEEILAIQQRASDPSTVSESDWELVEANVHEVTHVLQMASTGFAFTVSQNLFTVVESAVEQYGDLGSVFEHRDEFTPRMASGLTVLDRPGDRGLTPRAILESLAFIQQKLHAYRGLTLAELMSLVDDGAAEHSYRSAFDVAVEYLGDSAPRLFVQAANLALYTAEPETVFIPLLAEFAAKASRTSLQSNHRIGTDLLGRRYAGLVLGTAESLTMAGHRHPTLDHHVMTLSSHARRQVGAYAEVYSAPLSEELLGVIQPTMAFPPTETGQTPMISSPADQRIEQDGRSMSLFRYYLAVSVILQQNLPDLAFTEPVPTPEAQAVAARPIVEPRVSLLRLTGNDLRSETEVAAWCAVLERLSASPESARSNRGMVFVEFVDADLADAGVQACLRAFFARVPHLLYFLAQDDGYLGESLSYAWAAYAAEDQVRMPDGRIGVRLNERTVEVAVRVVRAAADFAEQLGEAGTTMLVHLEGLPVDGAAQIRRRVFGG
ncbi:hypothetical protein FB561_6340 [Kribbella amoyensis]|uniref:Uncharacterized protein n=1 Tax=Kribbella amoyensis TaxID=996641 RepID=A0A561B7F8_9ACTN|nr:hypothetical protein [Kribbella amoyensis]TWD74905.1 hypothetical protein FB561_6340 [Kribbella amoyensis]